MCVKSIRVLNPNYERTSFCSVEGEIIATDPRLYSTKKYIEVPCGHCPDCRNTYYNSLLQRCIVESRSSYMYFVTLTYDNKHIPSLTFGDYTIFYSDYKHIQNMFKRIRFNNILDRDFRYLSVCEFGDVRHRPHHHLLIFVSKLDTDTDSTPYIIERTLFDNLKRYYAVNIGTRKNPYYECLFTYALRRTPSGIKTNYFVKYVDISHNSSLTVTDSDTLVKTIRYLIGYLNKSSAFDTFVGELLAPLKITDPILYARLSTKLRSRCRYSKGLGFGFINGKKHTMQPIYNNMSLHVAEYNIAKQTLPPTWEEFQTLYPDEAQNTIDFLWRSTLCESDSVSSYMDTLRKHYDWDSVLFDFDKDSLLHYDCHHYRYFINCCIYFPKTIDNIVKAFIYDTHIDKASISYLFDILHKKSAYRIPTINTYKRPTNDPVYNYIRTHLAQGLKNKVPFIPFIIPSSIPQYTPLCAFYKRFCTTNDDILNMYKSIGCENYDQWQEQFEHFAETSLRRATISKTNESRADLSENTIYISQNIDLSLSNEKQKDLFTILFTN